MGKYCVDCGRKVRRKRRSWRRCRNCGSRRRMDTFEPLFGAWVKLTMDILERGWLERADMLGLAADDLAYRVAQAMVRSNIVPVSEEQIRLVVRTPLSPEEGGWPAMVETLGLKVKGKWVRLHDRVAQETVIREVLRTITNRRMKELLCNSPS